MPASRASRTTALRAMCLGALALANVTACADSSGATPTAGPDRAQSRAVETLATPTETPPLGPEAVDITALTAGERIGVQVFEADIPQGIPALLSRHGVKWARTRVLWKLAEPEPGRYDWAASDPYLTPVADAGLKMIAAVYANPGWAGATECGPVQADALERYSAFWTETVERYDGDGWRDAPGSPRVDWWQVSNEADFDPSAAADGDYGGCFGDDPAAYAVQYQRAHAAARAADPTSRVTFGPVAYDRFTPATAAADWQAPPGPFARDFTRQALNALRDLAPSLVPDAFAVHNYNDNAHYWDRQSGQIVLREVAGKLPAYREDQLAPGLGSRTMGNLPIMVTETGLAARPSDEWTERSPEMQSIYATQTLVRSLAAGASLVVWYTASDNLWAGCDDPIDRWLAFGLWTSTGYETALNACGEDRTKGIYDGGHSRPAFDALSTAAAMLAHAAWSGQASLDQVGDPGVEAYRFTADASPHTDADADIAVAWTTHGHRLGIRGVEALDVEVPIADLLGIDESSLGEVLVVSHLGELIDPPRGESSLWRVDGEITLTQTPVYVVLPRNKLGNSN